MLSFASGEPPNGILRSKLFFYFPNTGLNFSHTFPQTLTRSYLSKKETLSRARFRIQ